MFEPTPQLASDLDWMLQSGQVDDSTLAKALLEEYSSLVACLAQALLPGPAAAAEAVRETFIAALLDVHHYQTHHHPGGVTAWIDGLALKTIRRVRLARQSGWRARQLLDRLPLPALLRARLEKNLPPSPSETPAGPFSEFQAGPSENEIPPVQAAFWSAWAGLPWRSQEMLLLQWWLERPLAATAHLLHLSEGTLKTELELGARRLSAEVESAGFAQAELPEGDLAGFFHKVWSERCAESGSAPAVLDDLHAGILQTARQRAQRRRGLASFREAGLIGAAALVVGLVIWGANRVLPEDTPTATPTPTVQVENRVLAYVRPGESLEALAARLGVSPEELRQANNLGAGEPLPPAVAQVQVPLLTPEGQATPVRGASLPPALTQRSSSDEIRQRLAASQDLWQTLWLDVQQVSYGPPAYIGPPRVQREQAWVSQPNLALALQGGLTGGPQTRQLYRDGHLYQASAQDTQMVIDPPGFETGSAILANSPLRVLVFPGQATWISRGGTFQAEGEASLAGRTAVVVNWLDSAGGREARLWIDSRTGLVLRAQTYAGPDSEFLVAELIVTRLELDRRFPANLYRPERAWPQAYANSLEGEPEPAGAARVTPAIELPVRARLEPLPPPDGFQPAHSTLAFQFPETLNLSVGGSAPAQLFADGYYLGELNFGLPWSLRCDRSPDGERLAFMAGSGEGAFPGLQWFNLSSPDKVYQPLGTVNVADFAFAPDSRRLAVITFDLWSGLNILTLGNGEVQKLTVLVYGRSPVWSPDGEYIALVGSQEHLDSQTMLVVRVSTGQVVYQAPLEVGGTQAPPDAPTRAWGINFPPAAAGPMEKCAAPPGAEE